MGYAAENESLESSFQKFSKSVEPFGGAHVNTNTQLELYTGKHYDALRKP